jgi:hypothetical protein
MKDYYLLTIGDAAAVGDSKREAIEIAYDRAKKVWEKKKLPSREPKLWKLIKEEKQ